MAKGKNKELEINTDEKVFKLEELLVEGAKVEVPITFDYPTDNGVVPVSAMIRPITSLEWNNTLKEYSNDLTNFGNAILNLGLLSTTGEPIGLNLIETMPAGVVDEILRRIQDLSGIKELMGF